MVEEKKNSQNNKGNARNASLMAMTNPTRNLRTWFLGYHSIGHVKHVFHVKLTNNDFASVALDKAGLKTKER